MLKLGKSASLYPWDSLKDENIMVMTTAGPLDLSLGEALQKAVELVNTIGEEYREAALPIILQHLIKRMEVTDNTAFSLENLKQENEGYSNLPTILSLNLSVNEFFQNAAPNTHIGRFVCGAYYLFKIGKQEQFTQADILEIYGKLREKKPQNFPDILNKCIKKVYIIDAPTSANGQRSWTITRPGEKYVEGLLNNGSTNNKK